MDSNDDQERLDQFEKPQKPQTPKWDQSAAEIGSEIASSFYPATSLSHSALRREIIKVIEAEREVAATVWS